ncbi:hypothetical protein L1280_002815 [Deinococcus sp. HSC-46F16]|uniref:hypothetical protein n=1 Tax=Deinococcus sp. HSC-46F16 TaxID=2910968 RepID=UPI00209D91F5|nr:hypothetical protein [Deinococcus sp. HSC-46F16]MCP2015647.1 hypothetical protein [Deinococcus sp. HSC-46F16]
MTVELSGWELVCISVVFLAVVIAAFLGGMSIGMDTPEGCDLCRQSGCTGACRKGGYR